MAASDDEGDEDFEKLRQSRNRKERRAGGWQSLGLDQPIYKGIEKKGFKQPTPIQRRGLPPILDGKDVVAMSRTGSGKTAAFVIPMLQKLKKRDLKGIRALLISPTRELALQTFKVVKELGRFTGLRCACLVGGDSIEEQFSTLHENPDILIATPGRLLHVVVEMNLRLNCVQLVVFDEADRLFEMGFLEQLNDILKRLPENRQTLLFSATLPKMLVDFAKAGLSDPLLVRLDVDDKVSELLSLVFVLCRPEERLAAMVALARQAHHEKKQTVLFCATMKHVEYVVSLLNRGGIDNAFIYSQLDATARKQNIVKFREKEVYILVVTDVAARGVDIPLLDTVINVHFPPKPKLFVHRAGRVARAGRTGTAVSLICPDELPYLADFFLFLGRPLQFATDSDGYDPKVALIGKVPGSFVGSETDFLHAIHDNNEELLDLRKKSENAMQKYVRTRPPPSAESMKRVKGELRGACANAAFHPYLQTPNDTQTAGILNQIANYKANATIFEVHAASKSAQAAVMKEARRLHGEKIRERREKKGKEATDDQNTQPTTTVNTTTFANNDEVAEAFSEIIWKKAGAKKLSRSDQMAEERRLHYIAYQASDAHSEKALAVDFNRQAESATVDMTADDEKGLYQQKKKMKWDRKLKRFVGDAGDDPAKKKIRTEDGTWLPATYKTGRYEMWQKKQQLGMGKEDEEGEEGEGEEERGGRKVGAPGCVGRKKGLAKQKLRDGAKGKNELKNKDQILKERKKKARLQAYQDHRQKENSKRKGGAMGRGGGARRGAGRGGGGGRGAGGGRGGSRGRGGGRR